MLGKVFDIYFAEDAQPYVQSEVFGLHSAYFQTLHQFAREVHPGSWSHNSALTLGEDGLIAFGILRSGLAVDVIGQRSLAELEQLLLKLVVGTVIEEAQGASARGGVVYHLCHHGVVIAEIEFVAYADFSGRLHEHIPKLVFLVEFAEQKHFDKGIGLLLVAEEASWEYLGVVEHHNIAVIKVVDDFLEYVVLYLTCSAVDDHET